MDSGIIFALIAAIAGGALHRQKHGEPKVRKGLAIRLWIVLTVGILLSLGAIFSQ